MALQHRQNSNCVFHPRTASFIDNVQIFNSNSVQAFTYKIHVRHSKYALNSSKLTCTAYLQSIKWNSQIKTYKIHLEHTDMHSKKAVIEIKNWFWTLKIQFKESTWTFEIQIFGSLQSTMQRGILKVTPWVCRVFSFTINEHVFQPKEKKSFA